jgi:hypothetical protein
MGNEQFQAQLKIGLHIASQTALCWLICFTVTGVSFDDQWIGSKA